MRITSVCFTSVHHLKVNPKSINTSGGDTFLICGHTCSHMADITSNASWFNDTKSFRFSLHSCTRLWLWPPQLTGRERSGLSDGRAQTGWGRSSSTNLPHCSTCDWVVGCPCSVFSKSQASLSAQLAVRDGGYLLKA